MIGFKTDIENEKKESSEESTKKDSSDNFTKNSKRSMENLENVENTKEKKSGKKSKNIIFLACLLCIFILCFLVLTKLQKRSTLSDNKQTSSEIITTEDTVSSEDVTEHVDEGKNSSEDITTQEGAVYDDKGNLVSENGVYDLDGNLITKDKDAIDVGLPNFKDSDSSSTTATVYSDSDYIKDLNGVDVPAVYNVKSRDYIKDFVNYESKRAIIDDGMEMYWLEISYNKKKYRCQIPYYVFKDLDKTGICVVEIEVLTLEGGEKIISYMQVVTDYSDLK